MINPLTLKGQIHGGVAQGVGQALMEQVVYEPDSGQLLTASFMDYAMPRADDFCDMLIESHPVPTKLNPLGAKGAGEAGTVGALPASSTPSWTRWLRSACASSTCRSRPRASGRPSRRRGPMSPAHQTKAERWDCRGPWRLPHSARVTSR